MDDTRDYEEDRDFDYADDRESSNIRNDYGYGKGSDHRDRLDSRSTNYNAASYGAIETDDPNVSNSYPVNARGNLGSIENQIREIPTRSLGAIFLKKSEQKNSSSRVKIRETKNKTEKAELTLGETSFPSSTNWSYDPNYQGASIDSDSHRTGYRNFGVDYDNRDYKGDRSNHEHSTAPFISETKRL